MKKELRLKIRLLSNCDMFAGRFSKVNSVQTLVHSCLICRLMFKLRYSRANTRQNRCEHMERHGVAPISCSEQQKWCDSSKWQTLSAPSNLIYQKGRDKLKQFICCMWNWWCFWYNETSFQPLHVQHDRSIYVRICAGVVSARQPSRSSHQPTQVAEHNFPQQIFTMLINNPCYSFPRCVCFLFFVCVFLCSFDLLLLNHPTLR